MGLLEADFGVAATAKILDALDRGPGGVHDRRAVSLPIRFLGTGEGIDDLEPFDAGAYARRLVCD